MKMKKSGIILLLSVSFLAIIFFSFRFILDRMNHYIEETGRHNMNLTIEQLEQTYDTQIEKYYNDLKLLDSSLFSGDNPSLDINDNLDFLLDFQEESGSMIIFLKNNGVAMMLNGQTSRLEIQSQLLHDLQNGKKISKIISRGDGGNREEGYLIAIPCEKYYVNGEEFMAVGALYDRTKIDSLMKIRAYDGKALLFLLDREGNVTYTNQQSTNFLRNYSLMKHLKKDLAITDQQYNDLRENFEHEVSGVSLFGNAEEQFYLGYCPLRASESMLICIAAKSVVNSTLLEYQKTVVQSTLGFGIILVLLTAGLIVSIYKMNLASQVVKFEKEKQMIQQRSIQELEIAKKKAEEASRYKSDFLSNMSHDIRTPMNAIVGITKLMEHEKTDPKKLEIYIHKVQTSSKHLLSLINDVLDMSKIESGEVVLTQEPVSIAEQVGQIDNIIRPQTEERKQKFEIRVHEIRHEYFISDAVRLRQILINLLSNAVKYTAPGGTIQLDLTELPDEENREGKEDKDGSECGSRDKDYARIRIDVTDTGYGMTQEFLTHIFEAFTRSENSMTNKIQGTGLGMAITKNIVDMMGGMIQVQSELNKGSCFQVTLPLLIDKDTVHQIPAGTVLLISDDNVLVRNLNASFQESYLSFSVLKTVTEGKTFLQEKSIDIVLLAGYLYDPQLGSLVKSLRKISKNPDMLVFCVDCAQQEQAAEVLEKSGADGLIARPFFLSNFARFVNEVQNKSENAGSEEGVVLHGMRFLCAEDNALNAEILDALLDMNGAVCKIYSDGQELVEAFAKVKPGEYDAILMDVQMPRMNGLEATRIIRQGENPLGKEIPIIAMTANAFSSDVRDCLNAGMDAHVSKPLDIGMLERTLCALQHRAAAGGGDICSQQEDNDLTISDSDV